MSVFELYQDYSELQRQPFRKVLKPFSYNNSKIMQLEKNRTQCLTLKNRICVTVCGFA